MDEASLRKSRSDLRPVARTNRGEVKRNKDLINADLVQKNPIQFWRVCVDHPLVLFYRTDLPNQFLIESLVEQKQRRVLFKLDKSKITACDQFLPSLLKNKLSATI